MADGWRLLGFIACAMLLTRAMRYAVRAELERAGIFRAERPLTPEEAGQVAALRRAGKLNAADSMRDRFRFDVRRTRSTT